MKRWRRIWMATIYLVIIICMLTIIFPMYLTAITAFKSPEMIARNFFALPNYIYLDNFRIVFTDSHFFIYLRNSVFVTGVSVCLILVLVPATAYAIVRNQDKRYFRLLRMMILSGIFIPFYVIMIPCVRLANTMGLMNTNGIIFFYLAFSLGTYVFLMEGYLKTIPYELEEAAIIDGCSVFQRFLKIIYPMITPMAATIAILVILWIWNDFTLPLVILNRDDTFWTLTLFQYNFRNSYTVEYNLAFASFFASMIPVTIAYVFLQKHIINGLTMGALKG